MLEESVEITFVIWRAGKDQDVIDVREAEVEAMKNSIDEALRRLEGVMKPGGHEREIVQAKRGCNGRLRNVIRVDRNLLKRLDDVITEEIVHPELSFD